MSVVRPREYYICDYCGVKLDGPRFKYTDNSGLDNKCYDMCSDKCMDEHKEYLEQLYKINPKKLGINGMTVEEHIKEFIWIN